MIGIPLGLLVANASEWFFHKNVLHALGKDRKSFWSFHWRDHHRECRLNGNRDRHYERLPLKWDAQGKEAAALAVACFVQLPLLPLAPFYVGTLWYCALNYYFKHKKAHMNTEWCRDHLPWHYDHHMGRNQDANWCVTKPWFDHLMGTRVPYKGTPEEREDLEKMRARCQR